jgi:O-antigen ligase
VSYYFGPYTDAGGPYRFTDPTWAISTLNKIFLLYFLGLLCIDAERKLKALVGVFIIAAVYLTYWANDRYLSGHVMGRLAGPVDAYGVSVYSDENNFSMLFVVALPFLWYLGHAFRSRWIRWGMWLVIPFGWHAIFLTASRGGLVGIAATTLLIAWRSKNKALGFLLIPALAVAYFWQAGDLMRARAESIAEPRLETSAEARLQAWQAASHMIADHPVTGVGLASFGPAFPHYSQDKPREAHNTILQITAESGILAGLSYLLLVASNIIALWRNGNVLKARPSGGRSDLQFLVNEATLAAIAGLFVCSMFLSLQMFEIFWCLSLMANAVLYLRRFDTGTLAPSPVRAQPIQYGVLKPDGR